MWSFCSLVAQMVKNLSAMWETRVWSLGQEEPLEKEMATHSSCLAWEIPWTEELDGLQSIRSQESEATEWLTHTRTTLRGYHKQMNLLSSMPAGKVRLEPVEAEQWGAAQVLLPPTLYSVDSQAWAGSALPSSDTGKMGNAGALEKGRPRGETGNSSQVEEDPDHFSPRSWGEWWPRILLVAGCWPRPG